MSIVILVSFQVKAKKSETDAVSTESISDLKDAIESLGIAKSEEDTLKEIKKELEEYDEDVRELDEVKNLVKRLDLHESRAAKLLFGRVNKMLNRLVINTRTRRNPTFSIPDPLPIYDLEEKLSLYPKIPDTRNFNTRPNPTFPIPEIPEPDI